MPDRDRRRVIDCETGEESWEDLSDEEIAERNEPPPEPQPTPVEELNAGIQEAAGLADIKAVFASWSEKYRDRL